MLSQSERDRCERYRDKEIGRAFANGRVRIRRILGSLLDRAPSAVAFGQGQWGKPALPNADGLWVSWSHAGGIWLLGASRVAEIGVDIETIDAQRDWEGPAGVALHSDERGFVDDRPAGDRARCFHELWVRKEALVKALGKGLHDSMRELSVIDTNKRVREVVATPGGARWMLHTVPAPDGAAAALAIGLPDHAR